MTVNDLSNGLAQVINTSGKVIGAAFFIDHEVAVTCAHVVLNAMELKGNVKPNESVRLKLPSSGMVTDAYIIRSGWYSPEKEDIAFLKIKDPQENVTVLELGDSLPGSDFSALGFPANFNSGLFATGKIIGKVPHANTNIDWLQISSSQISPGFSGSPLWREESSSVSGMIQALMSDKNDTAFAISADTIKSLYPSKDNIIERISTAERYSDYQQRNQALVDLIPRMLDFESDEDVINLVDKIDEPIYKIEALILIAELVDSNYKSRVALDALVIVKKLGIEKEFVEYLNKVIPYLPKQDLLNLSTDILKIKTESLKVSVLKQLLEFFPDDSFNLAIPLVRIIESPEERASLLLDIAPNLSDNIRPNVFIEAMNAARSVIDPQNQAQLLQKIIPYLPKDFQERETLLQQDEKVVADQPFTYNEQIKIISRAIDDRPSEIDLLGFSAYSSALADFIRDKNTLKPITIGIDASWGMGKTTLMKMIRKELLSPSPENVSRSNKKNQSPFPVVWFNAWKYDKEHSLWAAFALDVLKQAKSQLNLRQRLFLSIKLSYKRIDRELILRTLSKLLLTAIVIYGFGAILYGIIGLLIGFHFFIQYVTAIGALGFLTALYSSGKELLDRLSTLDLKLSEYVREPNYREKIGFLADFEEDFKGLISAVTEDGKRPLIIFIDDLDRCSPPKPVEIIEAINFLLDTKFCVFILGMDSKTVAASIEAKYKDLNLKTDQGDPAGLTLGETFLEKIIQINFRIPPVDFSMFERFIDSMMEINEPLENAKNITKKFDRQTIRNWIASKSIEMKKRNGKELTSNFEVRNQSKDPEESPITSTFDDSSNVRQSIREAIPYLSFNPRKIKRFINIFRLQALIADHRALIRNNQVSLNLLSKAVILSMRWPGLVSQVIGDQMFIQNLLSADDLFKGLNKEVKEDLEKKKQLELLTANYNLKKALEADDLINLLKSIPSTEYQRLRFHLQLAQLTSDRTQSKTTGEKQTSKEKSEDKTSDAIA